MRVQLFKISNIKTSSKFEPNYETEIKISDKNRPNIYLPFRKMLQGTSQQYFQTIHQQRFDLKDDLSMVNSSWNTKIKQQTALSVSRQKLQIKTKVPPQMTNAVASTRRDLPRNKRQFREPNYHFYLLQRKS